MGLGAAAIAASVLPAAAARSTGSSIRVDQATRVFAVGGAGHVKRLTPPHEGHFSPVWAPDGSKFVTVSALRVEVRGRHGRLIHSFRARVWSPERSIAWSPDGRRLAFVAYRPARHSSAWEKRLVVASVEGSGRRALARRHLEGAPIWSPDGGTIYFARSGGRGSIWAVPSDGGPPRVRVRNGAFPALSPDGRRLLFFRFGPDNGLKIARSDGSGEQTLTHDQYAGPWGWLPQRNKIFYFRRDRAGYHLRVITPSGATQESTGAIPSTANLVWSPDRTRVAWTAGGYAKDVVVRSARPDGTGIRTLARFTSKSLYTEIDSLSWAPGRRVLVEVHEHWGD